MGAVRPRTVLKRRLSTTSSGAGGAVREEQRRKFLLAAGALLPVPLAAEAQQKPQAVRRIGVLMYQSRSDEFVPLFAAFRQGLREAGYVEGQNITIEWQDARGSHARLPALAADLVRLKV